MIAKLCKVGSQPRRLIDYLGRTARPNAFLLDANVPGSSPTEWAGWIASVNQTYRPRKGQFVKHFVLSYATGEHRPDDEMRETVRFFLQRMGYGEAPYVAFLHKDTDNDHVHIVTTPTTWEGQAISEAFDKLRSVRIAREIEERWSLVRVEAPEAAYLKSPGQGEMQRAAKGEQSMRAVFQVEVAQAGRDSQSFADFLTTLRARGFSTQVLVDQGGQLRGISFSRDGVAFKGSQLGRAFRAGKLLSTFHLSYDPDGDRAEVLRLAGRRPPGEAQAGGSGEPRGLRDALRREPDGAEDLRQLDLRPELPARQLVSLDWLRSDRVMPDGPYIVLPLSQKEVAAGLERIDLYSADAGNRDLTLQQALAEARRAERSGAAAILMRGEGAEHSRLVGFRNLTAEQVVTLRRGGFEPAVLVRVGDRYDLWLRSHEHLSPEERSALRQEIADRYGIGSPKGRFQDAIRLPGSSFENAGQRFRVRLTEATEEPFSASRPWLQALRGETREGLQHRLRGLDAPRLEAPLTRAEACRSLDRETFPHPSRLGGIEAHLALERRRAPRDAGSAADREPIEAFIARAQAINQEAIREALAAEPGGPREARERLLAVESELAGRLREAGQAFEGAREKMLSAWQSVEAAAATVEATPSLDRIYAYQVLAHAYGLTRLDLDQAEHAYSRLALAQLSRHRERFGWSLVERDRPDEHWAAFERLVRREARLAIQLGLAPQAPAGASTTAGELRAHLGELEERWAQLRSQGGLAQRWPEAVESLRVQTVAKLLLERAEAREARPARLEQGFLERAHQEPSQVLRGYSLWRVESSERVAVEEALAIQGATARERLAEATSRVAAGDLSPETLRRLNAFLLIEIPPNRITLPVLPADAGPHAGLDALARLAPEIVNGAQRLAGGDTPRPEEATRLFASSAEAVAWLRHLDRQQRATAGIPEPGRPPREVSELAWRAAWVEVASGRGLPPQAAASHLGNLARASPEGAPRAFDIAVTWGLSLGRDLAHRAGQWLRDVLADGEERRVHLRR